jgi:hypothetical protein
LGKRSVGDKPMLRLSPLGWVCFFSAKPSRLFRKVNPHRHPWARISGVVLKSRPSHGNLGLGFYSTWPRKVGVAQRGEILKLSCLQPVRFLDSYASCADIKYPRCRTKKNLQGTVGYCIFGEDSSMHTLQFGRKRGLIETALRCFHNLTP